MQVSVKRRFLQTEGPLLSRLLTSCCCLNPLQPSQPLTALLTPQPCKTLSSGPPPLSASPDCRPHPSTFPLQTPTPILPVQNSPELQSPQLASRPTLILSAVCLGPQQVSVSPLPPHPSLCPAVTKPRGLHPSCISLPDTHPVLPHPCTLVSWLWAASGLVCVFLSGTGW